MKKYILPVLIALSALSVSASAAYYSITGLSKLFAGASFAIIIMASSLEVAKLVIASFLYQYWTSVNKFLKTYLAIALGVLILITSAGIYGFLSSAYQSTASKNIVVEKQIAALETKKANYTKTRDGYAKDKEQVAKSTSDLRSGLTTGTITQYKDRSGQIMNVANTGNRKSFEKQLESTTKEEEKLSGKIEEVPSQPNSPIRIGLVNSLDYMMLLRKYIMQIKLRCFYNCTGNGNSTTKCYCCFHLTCLL